MSYSYRGFTISQCKFTSGFMLFGSTGAVLRKFEVSQISEIEPFVDYLLS